MPDEFRARKQYKRMFCTFVHRIYTVKTKPPNPDTNECLVLVYTEYMQ